MHYKDIINIVLYNKCIRRLKRVYGQMSKKLIKWMDSLWSIWTPYSENCESIGPPLTHS